VAISNVDRLRLPRADGVGSASSSRATTRRRSCVYGGRHRRRWYPITPSSSLAEAFARHCGRYRVDPETRKHRYASSRPRTSWPRSHGDRRRVNGARAFPRPPPRHLADAGIHRPRLFAEIPAVTSTPARRPVDRHADAQPAIGRPRLRLSSHGDTKHVLLFPEYPTSASRWAPSRSTSPTGFRRRSSSSSTRHRHERAAVRAAPWDDNSASIAAR